MPHGVTQNQFKLELTNSIRKLVSSLGTAKARRETGLFMAEGTKCVTDTIHSFSPQYIFATQNWIDENGDVLMGVAEPVIVKRADMARMSQLTTPPEIIAVYSIPDIVLDRQRLQTSLTLALDRVQDPGNLGTIIRIADWMGVKDILCTFDTVDVYNPKVIQATMGAISRVRVHYVNLQTVLSEMSPLPVFGTFLDGENIYTKRLPTSGIVVMGNEGNGISDDIGRMVTDRLFIPPYPLGQTTSESLNVAVATAITLSEFRRQHANMQF